MQKRFLVTASVLGTSLMLSGCAFQAADLKETEQDRVAEYCAQVVSKYNRTPGTGLTSISAPVAEDTEKSDETEASSDGSTTGAASSDGTTDLEEPVITKTFTEAIGIKGIKFLFRDAKVSSGYNSSDAYDLSPDAGKELLIVRLKASNTSSKSKKIDMTSRGLTFQATYGDDTENADITLLLNDLTNYQGTIKMGKGRNMVMIFQFPKGTIKDTKKVTYTVKNGDTSFQINTDLSKKR